MDEQNEVLDLLRRWAHQGVVGDADEILASMGAVVQRSALPGLQRARLAGGGILDVSLDEDADESEDAEALSKDLIVPLRERIQRNLIDGLEGAEGRVRSVFREWRSTRLEAAVDAAVLTALSRGVLDAIDEQGMVRWVCPIGHECDDGAENELIGAVHKGATFPSGHLIAPAYSGCRCLVVPADR